MSMYHHNHCNRCDGDADRCDCRTPAVPQHHYPHHHHQPAVQPVYVPHPPPLQYVTESPCPCEKGERGPQGYPGARGPQGEEGKRGPAGRDGLDGQPGDAGPEGPQGIQGDKGEKGDQGDIGLTGAQGIQGEKGDPGEKGEKGDQGDIGLTGAQGIQGDQGIQGVKGDTGDQGIQGPIGMVGPQGDQGIQGEKGDTGDQGIQGVQGDQGPSGMISCDFDDVTNCYNVQAVLQDGTIKDMQLGGCVTLLACGYAGNPICVTDATGTIVDADANGADIEITYTIAGATLVSMVEVDDTINSGTTSVSNFRMEGNRWCYDITTQGKVDVTNRFDIAGLPRTAGSGGPTPDGCRSPMSGSVEIDGLVTGGGQATQINKTTGGNVTQTGFNNIGGGNYDIISDTNSWVDTIIQPNVFGGDPNATQGSRHSFIVDTFGDNQQSFTVCEEFCYYEPIEYETDLSGNPIAGTGVDASGNPYSGTVFNYDGTSVTV